MAQESQQQQQQQQQQVFFDYDEIVKYSSDVNTNTKTSKIQELTMKLAITTDHEPSQTCSNYDTVYALGDLHADFTSFYRRLIEYEIIKDPDPQGTVANQIANFVWIPKRTILVITGDIIDGRRPYIVHGRDVGSNVVDEVGSSEILLHMFLKNLKYKAKAKESDVVCIIGNHDMFLFYPENKFFKSYVHEKAIHFYGSLEKRRDWLAPFYRNNFYFLFELMHEDKNIEIQFVHGALHSKENKSLIDDTRRLQGIWLNKTRHVGNFQEYMSPNFRDFWNFYVFDDNASAFWERLYINFEENDERCNDNVHKIVEGPTIIVGHCLCEPYDGDPKERENDDGQPYKINTRECKSNNLECIYPKCFDEKDVPKIVMIDTAMSSCFWDKAAYDRSVEILRISHTATKETTATKPYFDNYETLFYVKEKGNLETTKLKSQNQIKKDAEAAAAEDEAPAKKNKAEEEAQAKAQAKENAQQTAKETAQQKAQAKRSSPSSASAEVLSAADPKETGGTHRRIRKKTKKHKQQKTKRARTRRRRPHHYI